MPWCCRPTAPNYRVFTATLSNTSHHGINTRQIYTESVLLENSNAETWTLLNGSDLTMRLYGFDFEDQGTLQFQPVSGVQFSELNIYEDLAIPEGTGLIWEYSTDVGTIWDAIVLAVEERLPNLSLSLQEPEGLRTKAPWVKP